MRIPFPERVPINRVAIFAIVLFAIQRLEGTTLFFSCGSVVFILIAALAFNVGGGLTRPAGAYIFFYSLLVVIIGLCYKAFLGEPGQSNLEDPRTDILVYVAGISGMFAAAFLSRRFSRKTALLQDVLPDSQMYRASIGCMIFGAFGWIAIASLGESAHLLQTGFNQLNQLMPLGIIIGVMYEIRSSGGKRSISLPVLIGAIYFFCFFGLVNFSKQGLLEPIVCWLLPVCALRFRLSTVQIVGCLLGVFIVFQYLVPYAQYGRRFLEPEQSLSERIALSYGLLEQIGDVREKYRQEEAEVPTGSGEYFNTAQGFWDRLQFISVDDPLINITDQGRFSGLPRSRSRSSTLSRTLSGPTSPRPFTEAIFTPTRSRGWTPTKGTPPPASRLVQPRRPTTWQSGSASWSRLRFSGSSCSPSMIRCSAIFARLPGAFWSSPN